MPVDDEKIKGALDDFENDEFLSAKEKLSAEIARVRDEFLEKALELRGKIGDEEPEDDSEEEDDELEADAADGDENGDDDDEDEAEKAKRRERLRKARLAKQQDEE